MQSEWLQLKPDSQQHKVKMFANRKIMTFCQKIITVIHD